MAKKPEETEEGQDSTLEERMTWNEGDIVFLDNDGNPMEPGKPVIVPQPGAAPTVHIYLPEEEE
jgi:hypothetical protein